MLNGNNIIRFLYQMFLPSQLYWLHWVVISTNEYYWKKWPQNYVDNNVTVVSLYVSMTHKTATSKESLPEIINRLFLDPYSSE